MLNETIRSRHHINYYIANLAQRLILRGIYFAYKLSHPEETATEVLKGHQDRTRCDWLLYHVLRCDWLL